MNYRSVGVFFLVEIQVLSCIFSSHIFLVYNCLPDGLQVYYNYVLLMDEKANRIFADLVEI